jgi:D-alanyl-D-alanine carboxypeptidase/D-alanyl-D-alanine-endopeptidase (penicillin-binding protein 4)
MAMRNDGVNIQLYLRSIAGVAAATILLGGTSAGADDATDATVPASVMQTIASVISKPVYAHSNWGIVVRDQTTGQTLLDQNGAKMYVPGSIMKTYSTGTALAVYGPTYRFRTPVYAVGTSARGTLTGNLVLVASGDFSFGLRDRPDGTLGFNSFPEIDHNYADTGFAGPALLNDSRPLAALDELAAKVRASGIRRIQGNVVIDDRLFTTFGGWPDGPIAPIWVNENVVDLTTTPGSVGKPAQVDWRPRTARLKVVASVTTVASGTKVGPLVVETLRPGVLRISGQIPADAKPVVNIWQVPDPAAFARGLFVEALRRAGVGVAASPLGPNPANVLPPAARYAVAPKLAEHVSPPLSEYTKVTLKISYNRGADLMVCLVAVRKPSRNCLDGLSTELKTIQGLGVSLESTIVYDGAGSVDDSRTSPDDETAYLRAALGQPWGLEFYDGLAILGVDGTQATNAVGTPAAGKIHIKDGTRVIGTEDQAYLPAKTQVGYVDAKSGRRLLYAVFVNNVPTTSATVFQTFSNADHDEAAIASAIQDGF